MQYRKIFLKKGKERSLLHFHPWVFSGALAKMEGQPAEGETVEVASSEGKFLGLGQFHTGSISVRIFSFTKVPVDTAFWTKKFSTAIELRKQLPFSREGKTNCYRLIHGEGDGIPGLIADHYNGTVVLQAHTTGMHKLLPTFASCLHEIMGTSLQAVYDKSAETAGKRSDMAMNNSFLYQKEGYVPGEIEVRENGNTFIVNIAEGQKTGFFLDQRDNRALLGSYCRGKKVLNAFSYSGAFSVYALAGGASLVHSVDSSAKAGILADKNVQANFSNAPHTFFCEEVFSFFKKQSETYDVFILDPPAFAKHISSIRQACNGYQRLNTEAMQKMRPGGILFTFSCSQAIDRKLFRQVLFAAAASAGREVKILHQLSQPADHPISMYHPEGEYLKGLVLEIGA